MAGQSLPSEAIRLENGSYKVKTDVKDLFTIELKGGDKKAGATSNVQIAVRTSADVNNDGFKNNEELIEAIKNAANGTNWVENATSSASEKGFKIAQTNTVVINSELIDALAGNNQNGGAFTIETVVPISNDVKVKAVNGTTVTFVSNTNKEYDITLNGAVENTSNAEDKYAIIDGSDEPSAYNENTVAIVTGTQSISATKLKSLHVIETSDNATLNAALVAGNIRVDGTLTTGSNDVTADEIYNSGTINVTQKITGTVTNDGTIDAQAVTATVTISAGKGKVTMDEATATNGIKVGATANQEVIFECTTTLTTTQIQAAAALSSVNAIKANDDITLLISDIAEFKNIKTMYAKANINTEGVGTYDMSALNIVLTQATTWTGAAVAQTKITGVKVNISEFNLTLNTIAVSGTATATTGKVIADGVSATWNGGASGQN